MNEPITYGIVIRGHASERILAACAMTPRSTPPRDGRPDWSA